MHHHAGDLLDDRKALQERSWPVLLDEACRRFVQWLAVLQDELLHESFGHPRIVSNGQHDGMSDGTRSTSMTRAAARTDGRPANADRNAHADIVSRK